jgi:hypothetical protein
MKTLTALFVLALFIGAISVVAMAGAPPVVPTVPPTSGGGGGSSGSSGSSGYAPTFKPYTDPIDTSDGMNIGQLTGQNFDQVLVSAEENGTVGNVSYDLKVSGQLSSNPPGNYWLDIGFLSLGSAEVPLWANNGLVLGVINITSSPSDWSYTSGPTYTLTISGLSQNPYSNGTYYMVLSDGTNYQVQPVSVSASGNGATLQFNPPGATGIFTIVEAQTATPTPAPTPTPTPVPSPTTAPLQSNNIWSFPILLTMFAIGAIVGAFALFILGVHR